MSDTSVAEAPIPPDLRPTLILNSLQSLSLDALVLRAEDQGVRVRDFSRHPIILDLARDHLHRQGILIATGILEMTGEGGVLRWPVYNFKPGPEDVLVSPNLLRPHGLQPGLSLTCRLRLPKDRERGLVADSILQIEGVEIAQWSAPMEFDKLTAMFPNQRFFLESPAGSSNTARAVDLIAPIGKGQRGLIPAPPRAGKTIILKTLAQAIRENHPEVCLILLLVDERPEEVTDLRRSVDCEIYSSTFDESIARHVQVCELVCERAKRLVELRKDVVVLIDSITRMARAYNNIQPTKGRTMSGGVDTKALAKPRKFFGSARNVEEGGSLTIVATALIETQSRMDDLIFEEFKGTGNMELYLDRSIAEQRVFPAIHIIKSGTRREELLYHPDEYERIVALRRTLSELPAVEAMEVLAANLTHTRTNAELLLTGLRGA